MAAITYWVDGSGGNDANTGKSYAQRIQTMSQLATNITADGTGNDYTINVLNTTSYTFDVSETTVMVDNQPTSTFHFRGVSDASATPALATAQAQSSGTGTFFYVRECTSCLVEYFNVDFTPALASATAQEFFGFREGSNDVEVRYCYVKGGSFAGGTTGLVAHRLISRFLYIDELGSVHHCIFENMRGSFIPLGGATYTAYQFYYNVIVSNHDQNCYMWLGPNFSSASHDLRCHHNTYYAESTNASIASFIGGGAISFTPSTGATGQFDLHSNLVWINEIVSTLGAGTFVTGGSSTPTSSITSGTLGYNTFYTGPDTPDVGSITDYSNLPFDPGVDDLYPGDTRADNKAATTLFNDPSSTYDWTPSGSSVAFTLPADLRPIDRLTSAYGGGVPGALPAAGCDISVTIADDGSVAHEGGLMTFSCTAQNLGPLDATGVELTFTVPTGVTYVTDSGNGTYDSGTKVWTPNDGGSGNIDVSTLVSHSFTFSFDAGTSGTTKVFGIARTASDQADLDSLNSVASDIVNVSPGNQSGDTAGLTVACIEGIYDYHYANDGGRGRQVIICADRNIYTDPGNHLLTARYYDLPTNGSKYSFVPMNSFCTIFSTNESQEPLKYGSTSKQVTPLNGAPNLGFAVEHFSRIVGAGVPESPSYVFSSGVLDQDNWAVGGNPDDPIRLGITVDDGQRITGLSSTHYGRLYVFKERSISALQGTWTSATDVSRNTVSTTRGCIAHHTIQTVGNDILFWSEQGCHSIIATDKFGDVETQDVSFPIRLAFRRLVDQLQLDTAFSVNYRELDLYMTWFKPKGNTKINTIFVYNYGINQWTIWQIEANCASNVIGDSRRRVLWVGGCEGYINEWPGSTFTSSGSMTTGGMMLGDARLIKNYEELSVAMVPWGDATMKATLSFGADDNPPVDDQIENISMLPNTGVVLDDLTLDEDKLSDDDEILVAQVDFYGGTGRAARIKLEQNTSNVGMEILGYLARITTKGT